MTGLPSPHAPADGSPTGERKLVTLLFVDLTGYTRMTATLDPEEVRLAVEPILAALRQVAEDHGGHVDSVQGDGFLAVFGAPTAQADSPRRAVAAAASMLVVGTSGDGLAGQSPRVHIGIASGEVLVSTRMGRQSVVGAAVNLASRLSDSASPGEVLVDEMSASMTADGVAYGPARSLSLSGFAGAVRALPLVGLGDSAGSDSWPVVGRADQQAALDAAYEAALATRSSRTVVVTGEAGLGKSRLVRSWCSRHAEALILRGSCRNYGSPLPLSALAEALSAGFGTVSDAPPEDPAAEPSGAAVVSDFLRLLPRHGVGSVREPDAALQVAARRLLEHVSGQRPTVLVLEDVHWADDSLREVLRSFDAEPISGQLLVVVTSRDAVPGLTAVALSPLGADEVAAVVEQRIGAPPDAQLLSLLVERSRGNPLWLVECLNLLSERGQIAIEGAYAVTKEVTGTAEVPASIRLLVSARLDAQPQATKQALQRAAAWPGDIPRDRWPGVPEQIPALVATGMLEQRLDGVLRFAHGLVREAVYRTVPRADRVAEHERLLAQDVDAATRAYAAREVQRLDVAPDEARREAVASRAVQAAVDHARHLNRSHSRAARDVLLHAGDLVNEVDAVVPGSCAVLLTELAEVLNELEDRATSIDVARRAVDLADLSARAGVVLNARLAYGSALVGTDNTGARRHAEAVLLATETEGPSVLRGRAWRLLADAHSYDDFAARQECLEEAFRAFQIAGASERAAAAARRLSLELSVTADTTFDQWLAAAESTTAADHVRGQAELALVRAVVAQARGDWEQSWESATAAMALAEQIGMHHVLVDSTAVAVEAATATGRRAALAGLLPRLASLVKGHRARLRVTALCASAPALLCLGREAEASRALDQAVDLLPSVGPNEETMLWSARGQCAEMAERYDEAQNAYRQAELLARRLGLTLFAQGCRLRQLTCQARQGDQPGLRDELLASAAELHAVRAIPLSATAHALVAALDHRPR